ncbi:hypothetical protein PoB_000413300 [Plakobranchus ocellatus]|uniref:Mitochondrial pyruvate carrier n=1 Tax=Plakobranchus ocellatus TaxID=259542 RepID=A0AAV3Y4Y9_9GAST|nr:hypothetical protein PoB_000413300 [Plakobranchus ocellatus]
MQQSRVAGCSSALGWGAHGLTTRSGWKFAWPIIDKHPTATSGFNSIPIIHTFFASHIVWGVCSTMDSEAALKSAGTLLLQVRVPPPAPGPDGKSET